MPENKKKRASERRNRVTPKPDNIVVGDSLPVPPPPGDPKWHPEAKDFYDSLAESAQAHLYEASDWSLAKLAASALSKWYTNGGPTTLLREAHWLMDALLVSEMARRRSNLEVHRGKAADDLAKQQTATVSEYKARLKSA